jgi:hypothetical protein
MAERRAPSQIKGRVEFVGLTDGDETPVLAARLIDANGKALETAEVGNEGAFEVSESALAKAEPEPAEVPS